MSMTREQQQKLAEVAWGGFTAMQFATDPQIWPAFAAWAEQHMPGTTWDEADRLNFAADARIMQLIAETADRP